MAYVATLRLESEMRFSRSTLQVATLLGCVRARVARVRVAANRKDDLGEDKNSCKTRSMYQKCGTINQERSVMHVPAMGFVSWAAVTCFISQIARAASRFTMSLLCRSQPSINSSIWRCTL